MEGTRVKLRLEFRAGGCVKKQLLQDKLLFQLKLTV